MIESVDETYLQDGGFPRLMNIPGATIRSVGAFQASSCMRDQLLHIVHDAVELLLRINLGSGGLSMP